MNVCYIGVIIYLHGSILPHFLIHPPPFRSLSDRRAYKEVLLPYFENEVFPAKWFEIEEKCAFLLAAALPDILLNISTYTYIHIKTYSSLSFIYIYIIDIIVIVCRDVSNYYYYFSYLWDSLTLDAKKFRQPLLSHWKDNDMGGRERWAELKQIVQTAIVRSNQFDLSNNALITITLILTLLMSLKC